MTYSVRRIMNILKECGIFEVYHYESNNVIISVYLTYKEDEEITDLLVVKTNKDSSKVISKLSYNKDKTKARVSFIDALSYDDLFQLYALLNQKYGSDLVNDGINHKKKNAYLSNLAKNYELVNSRYINIIDAFVCQLRKMVSLNLIRNKRYRSVNRYSDKLLYEINSILTALEDLGEIKIGTIDMNPVYISLTYKVNEVNEAEFYFKTLCTDNTIKDNIYRLLRVPECVGVLSNRSKFIETLHLIDKYHLKSLYRRLCFSFSRELIKKGININVQRGESFLEEVLLEYDKALTDDYVENDLINTLTPKIFINTISAISRILTKEQQCPAL